MTKEHSSEVTVFIVAGEESGDRLGANLMLELSALMPNKVKFEGVGGEQMSRLGLNSIFPLSDIAVMGITLVLRNLPRLLRRIKQTINAVVESNPDVLVIIDSPDFTHRVAKKVRKRLPGLPIVNYVSPSVWAWRGGRAKSMNRYIDRILAILPFEPEVHKKLGGPKCFYVGHPLINQLNLLRPQTNDERIHINQAEKLTLLVLPGSRRGEIEKHLTPFGEIVESIIKSKSNLEIVIPTMKPFQALIQEQTNRWTFPVNIVVGENEKFRAFRCAHGALAVSGTVSLELALAGVPMIIAYKTDWILSLIYAIHKIFPLGMVNSFVLPNIILEEKIIPEFLNKSVNALSMGPKLVKVLSDSDDRREQENAFTKLSERMDLEQGGKQATNVAQLVLEMIK